MAKVRSIPVAADRITGSILILRGQRVILDADLAVRYRVSTKALNQAPERRPSGFTADIAHTS